MFPARFTRPGKTNRIRLATKCTRNDTGLEFNRAARSTRFQAHLCDCLFCQPGIVIFRSRLVPPSRAIGVLQPPYDHHDTLGKMQTMIKWAQHSDQARTSIDASVVDQELNHERRAEIRQVAEDFVRREHEASSDSPIETVTRSPSPPVVPPEANSPGSYQTSSLRTDDRRASVLGAQASPSPMASPCVTPPLDPLAEAHVKTEPARSLLNRLSMYDWSSRRRSVDNGRLARIVEQAAHGYKPYTLGGQYTFTAANLEADAGEPTDCPVNDSANPYHLQLGSPKYKKERSSSLAEMQFDQSDTNGQQEPRETATIVAELLGEMYRQTRIVIETQMVDYPE